jgi:hypothetical protein
MRPEELSFNRRLTDVGVNGASYKEPFTRYNSVYDSPKRLRRLKYFAERNDTSASSRLAGDTHYATADSWTRTSSDYGFRNFEIRRLERTASEPMIATQARPFGSFAHPDTWAKHGYGRPTAQALPPVHHRRTSLNQSDRI